MLWYKEAFESKREGMELIDLAGYYK